MKGWYGDKHKHGLASKGIRTKANGVRHPYPSVPDAYMNKLKEWFGNMMTWDIAHHWTKDDGITHLFVIYSEEYNKVYAVRMWDMYGEIAISIDNEYSIE